LRGEQSRDICKQSAKKKIPRDEVKYKLRSGKGKYKYSVKGILWLALFNEGYQPD
jgi:hypothetical protein